jgi:hypothetical protein
MRFLVVVAKYKESMAWMSELRVQSLVFNKNREEDHLFDFNLPNRGRETDTFLEYIIKSYHDLPEYVAFLQGNPLDHCPSCVGILNEFAFDRDFKALGKTYYRDTHILSETLNWAKFCDLEIKSPPKFISGMQCIVSKKRILARSKESYENLHSKVSKEIDFNSHTGYYFEYLWPTILGFNEELEVGGGDC